MRTKLFGSLVVVAFVGIFLIAGAGYCTLPDGTSSAPNGPSAIWKPEQSGRLAILGLLNQALSSEGEEESDLEGFEAIEAAMEAMGIKMNSEGLSKDGKPVSGFNYEKTEVRDGKVTNYQKVTAQSADDGKGGTKVTYATVTIKREYKNGILVKETETREGYESGTEGDTNLHKEFKTTTVTTYNSLGLTEKIVVDSWNAGEGGGSTVHQVIDNTEFNKYGQAKRRTVKVDVEGGQSYTAEQWNIQYKNGEIVKYEEKRTEGK